MAAGKLLPGSQGICGLAMMARKRLFNNFERNAA
jgi:hypothetical protein